MKTPPLPSSPVSEQLSVLDPPRSGDSEQSSSVPRPSIGGKDVRSSDAPLPKRAGKLPMRTQEVSDVSSPSVTEAKSPAAEVPPLAGAVVGACAYKLPYLALPRPSKSSVSGLRIRGFQIWDQRTEKNKRLLSSTATGGDAQERAAASRNEKDAIATFNSKCREIGTDDPLEMAKLARLVDNFDESTGPNTKSKRDALSSIQARIAGRFKGAQGATDELAAEGLLIASQSPDARFEKALEERGSAFWILSARSASYRRMVAAEKARAIKETKRPFKPGDIWEMRAMGMHHTMDLVSVPVGRMGFFNTELSLGSMPSREMSQFVGCAAAATLPAVENLSAPRATSDETPRAVFEKTYDQAFSIFKAVATCELAINAQINALRALYATKTPSSANEFRKTGSTSLQKLQQASRRLTEIRMFVGDFPLPSQDPAMMSWLSGEQLQSWEADHERFIERLDERQVAVDALIGELAEDLDTFAPAPRELPAPVVAPGSTAPGGPSRKNKKKAADTAAIPSSASNRSGATKARTMGPGKASASPPQVPPLNFSDGELPSLASRQRWFTDMVSLLETLQGLRVSVNEPASKDASELSKLHDEALAASQEASLNRDAFLHAFTSEDRASAARGELMGLLKSAAANASLALEMDGQFKDVDREQILAAAWTSLGRAAALEDLLERELPLQIGHEHVIDEAINRSLDNRFQLPYSHSPTVPDDGGISIVKTVGTRRRPGGPMLRIQLDHPPGDGVRWLRSNGIDVPADAPLHDAHVDTDAWVLHYHMAEKHRDKEPEDFDVSRLRPEDLGFGSSKLARFERQMERLVGHPIGRGLRHREGMDPGSLSPALGIDLIAANASRAVPVRGGATRSNEQQRPDIGGWAAA